MEVLEQTRLAEVVFGGGDDFFDLRRCSVFLAGLDGICVEDCPLNEAAWIAAQTAARRPVTIRYREEEGGIRRFEGLVFRHHQPEAIEYDNRGPEDDSGDPELYAYRHSLVEVTVGLEQTSLHFHDPEFAFEGVPAAVARAIGAYTAQGLKSVVIFQRGRIRTVRLRMNPDRV
ncbi:MAG: hypothetical protein KC910_04165 [Candidatus Eremiobacteraeota bacterium]|nr:hypothetical protein [Candidatus Eremiobacteraeota bacterium]